MQKFSKIQVLKDSFIQTFKHYSNPFRDMSLFSIKQIKTINGIHIPYVVNDEAVLQFTKLPTTLPGIGVGLFSEKQLVVLVNQKFFELPTDVQDALFLHYHYFIKENIDIRKYIGIGAVLKRKEILRHKFNADNYAFLNDGEILTALLYFRYLGVYNNCELDKRITELLTGQ